MGIIKKILIVFLWLGAFVVEDVFAATEKFQIKLSVIDPTIINIDEYDINFEEILGKNIIGKEVKDQKILLQGRDGSEVEVVLSEVEEKHLLVKEKLIQEELVSKKERNPRSNDPGLTISKETKLKERLIENRGLNITMNYR